MFLFRMQTDRFGCHCTGRLVFRMASCFPKAIQVHHSPNCSWMKRMSLSHPATVGEYGEGYIRVGLLEDEGRLEEAVRRIKKLNLFS